jgi:hypothetical protein
MVYGPIHGHPILQIYNPLTYQGLQGAKMH